MSPKINIMLNSNFVSPKIAPKSFSSMKKSNKVVNTSINSGVKLVFENEICGKIL